MKDYSKLSMHLIIAEFGEISDDATILEGLAIPAKHKEDFLSDVERLAIDKYGAATFDELLEHDLDDSSAAADKMRRVSKQIARGLAEANRFTAEDLRKFQKAADRGKAEYEQRKKAEESLRRKAMSEKRASLGLKVIRTNNERE